MLRDCLVAVHHRWIFGLSGLAHLFLLNLVSLVLPDQAGRGRRQEAHAELLRLALRCRRSTIARLPGTAPVHSVALEASREEI